MWLYSYHIDFSIWRNDCTICITLSNAIELNPNINAIFPENVWKQCPRFMMISSNENIFRVTDHLCGEFTGPQRPVTRSFHVFFDLHLSKQSWGWCFETSSCPFWRHCNFVSPFMHWLWLLLWISYKPSLTSHVQLLCLFPGNHSTDDVTINLEKKPNSFSIINQEWLAANSLISNLNSKTNDDLLMQIYYTWKLRKIGLAFSCDFWQRLWIIMI